MINRQLQECGEMVRKRDFIYRFLSTGTIEEKVYQRQMSKEGLQKVIQQGNVDSEEKGNSLFREDLRDVFTFRDDIRSEIHENMNCPRCRDDNDTTEGDNSASDIITGSGDGDIGGFAKISGCWHEQKRYEEQIGTPLEEDLMSWGHHSNPSTVPDSILQSSDGDEISFVFTNQVDGKLVPVESIPKCSAEKPSAQLKMQRSSLPVLPSSKNNPILQQSKSLRTLRIRHPFSNKPITYCENQSTPKRRHLSSDISDDDFV